jgi:hypothetical protein
MYIGLWLLSAGHVSILLHPHCTSGPSPYIYKRKVQGPRTEGGRAGGRADEQALSLSPSRTLVTPYCKRIHSGAGQHEAAVSPSVFRLAPTHLGWGTQRQFTRRSSDPRGRNVDTYNSEFRHWFSLCSMVNGPLKSTLVARPFLSSIF